MHRQAAPPETTWTHHPSLDGLRSIAVYLVVLYHCGVGWLAGGFVGVDLFFVLSGFLVSTILFEELAATGRIDLPHFYDRRMRRLLPAAVVVVVATCAVSLVFLSEVRRLPLIGDGQAALLYVANWHFLSQSNDYFAAAGVDSSLFLHFWSLSIEEQFYVLFPFLVLVLARLDRLWHQATPVVLAGLLTASLTAQLLWSRVDVNHAYYGTETRFYQLLAGALLALVLHRARLGRRAATHQGRARASARVGAPVAVGAVVALVGVVVVATSALDVGTSYRGVAATAFAVPLVAALAVSDRHPVARLLSGPQLVYLGRISYGTYLWHWPVAVLLREVVSAPPARTASIVVVLSTGLAAASFQLLERPIRARRVRRAWRAPVLLAGLAASVAAAVLVVPGLLDRPGTPALVSARTVSVGTAANGEGPVPDIDYRLVAADKGWPEKYCRPGDAADCFMVEGQPGPNVMLVGDSHARMLGPALGALAEKHGFNLSVQILGACPWPDGLVTLSHGERTERECAQARHELYDELLRESGTDVVILTMQGRDHPFWDGRLGRVPDEEDPDPLAELLYETTHRTLARLSSEGIRSLVVHSIWLPPSDLGDPLDCLASSEHVQQCRVPISPEPGLLDADYLAAAARLANVHTVDINRFICPAEPVCDPVLDGLPVWRDRGHYTPAVILHERAAIWRAIERSGVFEGLL